jgi:ElaB/YqjD/DUF883 family membrane-anchored ribosome-binding protein
MAMNTLDTLSSYADEATQQAGKAAQQVSRTAQQMTEQANEALRSGYRQTRQIVRQQPIESVLVCFAAGMVGGFCIAMALRGMR